MSTISEQEFKNLCERVYADRRQIYEFNPAFERRDALLWMLLGCLFSLLSVPELEQASAYDAAATDPYAAAIRALLRPRMTQPFDAQAYIDELARRIEAEEE